MTEAQLYNLLMNNAAYRNYLEQDDYKNLYNKVCKENSITPKELTQFLTGAGIRVVRDGKIPPQVYKDSKVNSFNFSDIKEVGTGAFMGSTLKEADLRNVNVVQSYAFMNSAISELRLPKTGTIMTGAFGHCVNLKELYIPPQLELKERAFEACTNLEEIFIEEGRNDFPLGVFAGIPAVPIVYIPGENPVKALKMFCSNVNFVNRYSQGEFRYVPRDSGNQKKKINILMIIGEENPQVVRAIKSALQDELYGLTINNIKFTG